jgi:hypothetical protein
MDKVAVDVFIDQAGYQANQPFAVDAWRRAGFMELIGTSGTGFSLGLSYAYGL